MKNLLVLLALLGLAGIPIYMKVMARPFGLGPRAPLGDHALLEDWLREGTVEQTEGWLEKRFFPEVPEEIAQSQLLHYDELDRTEETGEVHRVMVSLDQSGAVRGVGAVFFSGRDQVTSPSSRTEELAQKMWEHIANEGPQFRTQISTESGVAYHDLVARVDRNGVRGTWVKSYLTTGEPYSIYDRVFLYIAP